MLILEYNSVRLLLVSNRGEKMVPENLLLRKNIFLVFQLLRIYMFDS